MLLWLAFLGILLLIFLIAYVKLDTFISFILVAITLGILSGMAVKDIGLSIKNGIGTTIGDLILIIGFGAMLGKLVAESGAAQRITDSLIKIFGQKYLLWGLALSAFIIGIPLFYNAGFIVVIPLILTVAASTRLPVLMVAMPMLSALSVAHGYLPPHPSPAAISTQLKADVGLVLIYGIIIAVPAIALAGPVFGKTLKKYNRPLDTSLFKLERIADEKLPSTAISFIVALMPVILLTLTSVIKTKFDSPAMQFLSEPYVGMLISVLFAIYFLGLRQGKPMSEVSKQLEESFKSIAGIFLIVAGAGALKQILSDSGISNYIGELLRGINLSPLILGWLIAAVMRVCVGSATIAGLTAVGILSPLIQQNTGIKPELMVLAIGSGSLIASHLNDSAFWLFKEYFNLTIKETLKTWTIMETIVSVVGLIGVLILNTII